MLEPGQFPLNEETHQIMVDNLMRRTRQFTPDTIAAGKSWYKSGQQDAEYLGQKFGRDTMAGAAVLARLSPRTDWNLNRLMGLQLLDFPEEKANRLNKIMEMSKEVPSDILKDMKSKFRVHLAGTPLAGQALPNINDALGIAYGRIQDPMSIFKAKPRTSQKTPDFAVGLGSGGKLGGSVVDTHGYDAVLDSHNIAYGTGNKHLAKAGVYHFVQNVYHAAHAKALQEGLIPSDTTAHDFQAMHWVHQIHGKVQTNPNAAKTAKASITKTSNLLVKNPGLDPVRHGLEPIVLTRNNHLIAFNEGMTGGR